MAPRMTDNFSTPLGNSKFLFDKFHICEIDMLRCIFSNASPEQVFNFSGKSSKNKDT